MIIFENHTYQITGGCPNENYLKGMDCEQPKWVVDDNSELAGKILSSPCWEPVEDENGNLTDIIPVYETALASEERAEEIISLLEELDMQAIRPLRAIAAGTDTDKDRETLAELEQQAEELRAELSELREEKTEENNG